MKWFLIPLIVFTSFASLAQTSSISGSLSSRDQDRQLIEILLSVPSDDPKENATALNKKLKELGLPTIDVDSPQLKMTPVFSSNIVATPPIGATFTDGKNIFCLPCEKSRNSFESGILSEAGYAASIFNTNKRRITDLLGSCEYDLKQTSVMQINNGDSEQFICNVHANCIKRAGTKNQEGLLTGNCLVEEKCPKDPIDCVATRSLKTVFRGADAVGTGGIRERATEEIQTNRSTR